MFLDARGDGRALRLTWHHEVDVVVLSLWREHVCAGTFRLVRSDMNAFVGALVDGLRDAPGVHLPDMTRYADSQHPPPGAPSPALPPRQRSPGSHAARPDDEGQAQTMPIESEQESFSDWAFNAPGRHRAVAS